MRIRSLSILLACAASLVAAAPAFADHDEGWKERRPATQKKKYKRDTYRYDAPHVFHCPPRRAIPGRPPVAELAPTPPARAGRGFEPRATPGYPSESPSERAIGKSRQRQILEQELATERELLADARRRLAEEQGAATAPNGAPPSLERHREAIEQHERNIDALRRELGYLER